MTARHPELQPYRQVESDFFKSLSYLAALYQLPLPPDDCADFPLNIWHAFEWMHAALKSVKPELDVMITQTASSKACLATLHEASINRTLLYVPVRPLICLLKADRNSSAARLLIHVFAYLLQVAGVAWYHEGNFIGDTYQWIEVNVEDCLAQEGADPEYVAQMAELTEGRRYGKIIYDLICRKDLLADWGLVLADFQPSNAWEYSLLDAATELHNLYMAFPQNHFCDHLAPIDEDEAMDLYWIMPECYLAFVWHDDAEGDNSTIDLIADVNLSLQEAYGPVLPVASQLFDCPQAASVTELPFETGLLKALIKLTEVLTTLNEKTT